MSQFSLQTVLVAVKHFIWKFMRVDIYSSKKPSPYALVVPVGTAIETFEGRVAEAINKLQPLEKRSTAELSDVYKGELLAFLEKQIGELGAGLVKVEVRFEEISG